ncbi:MAG TPA: hypothetical protein VFC21_05170 [Bryobacteraceae bacterium]|nr:hypothetical protein [Bryobacteraceae bacterium]
MLVVVGGHSRNIGKTSVACGIIRNLPEFRWTAIKITQYPGDPLYPVAPTEEYGANPTTDSGRFLAAGAERAFWLRTSTGRLSEGLPHLRRMIDEAENALVESNSVLEFLQPDLYLMTVNGAIADFKPTSRRFLDRAQALVVTSESRLEWEGVPPSLLETKPRYEAFAPAFENADLIELVRLKLSGHTADRTHR